MCSSLFQCLCPNLTQASFSLAYVQIFWSDSGELVCIATEESFFILRYLADKVAASQESNEGVTEDGIEDAFEVSVQSII